MKVLHLLFYVYALTYIFVSMKTTSLPYTQKKGDFGILVR